MLVKVTCTFSFPSSSNRRVNSLARASCISCGRPVSQSTSTLGVLSPAPLFPSQSGVLCRFSPAGNGSHGLCPGGGAGPSRPAPAPDGALAASCAVMFIACCAAMHAGTRFYHRFFSRHWGYTWWTPRPGSTRSCPPSGRGGFQLIILVTHAPAQAWFPGRIAWPTRISGCSTG